MKSFVKYLFFKSLLSIFFGLVYILKKRQLKTLSKVIGFFFFLIPWKRKYIALDNMKIAFGNRYSAKELKKFLKNFIQEVILIALEVAFIVKRQEKFTDWAYASGLESLEGALKKGKGVIALSGHLGNIVIMLGWFANKGYPVAVLFKEGKYLPEGFLFNLIKKYNGYPIPFRSDEEIVKEIIRALNRNMMVFMLADQARPGVYARFFGKYVQCQKGAFLISRRKDSSIVPIFIVREKDKHRIIVYPELKLDYPETEKNLSDEQIINLVEKYNSILENLITKYPEQYYWFHRRFKKMKSH